MYKVEESRHKAIKFVILLVVFSSRVREGRWQFSVIRCKNTTTTSHYLPSFELVHEKDKNTLLINFLTKKVLDLMFLPSGDTAVFVCKN